MGRPKAVSPSQSQTISSCRSDTSASASRLTIWCRSMLTSTWTDCSRKNGSKKMLTPDDYMEHALFLAARGRGLTSPNPVVGAVVVSSDGVVVGQGFHQRAGEPHAEVRALDAAGARAAGATLYCTLEPCSHVGRTGPCVERIVNAGIVRVVAAIED